MKLYFITTSFAIATMPSARDNVAATKGPPSRLRFMFHKQYNAQCEIQGNSHCEEGSCPIIAIAVAMARDLIVTGKNKQTKSHHIWHFCPCEKRKKKKGTVDSALHKRPRPWLHAYPIRNIGKTIRFLHACPIQNKNKTKIRND